LEWLGAFRQAVIAAETECHQELGVLRVDGMAAALQAYNKDSDPLGSVDEVDSKSPDRGDDVRRSEVSRQGHVLPLTFTRWLSPQANAALRSACKPYNRA